MIKVRLNLRKGAMIFACLLAATVFWGCGKEDKEPLELPKDPLTYDEGVVINGVKWATRNVDKPGTFAVKPESGGMFYKWNSKVAWFVVGESVENWDNSMPAGTEWVKENDPSPTGWRIPTKEELQKLLDAGYVLTEVNGVSGLSFGTAPNSLFLPIQGGIGAGSGGRITPNVAAYWSGDLIEGKMNYLLYNDNLQPPAQLYEFSLAELAMSIRCVAK
jgi:hypothetical protein